MVNLDFLKMVEESHYFVRIPIGCTLEKGDPIPHETDMYGVTKPINLKRLTTVRLPLLRIAEIVNDGFKVRIIDNIKTIEIMENTHKYVKYVDMMNSGNDDTEYFDGKDIFLDTHEMFFSHRDIIYNLGMSVAKHNKDLYYTMTGDRIDPLAKTDGSDRDGLHGTFDQGGIL